ncbi:glycosyltransferase family 92 protein [Oceanibium sediminis]|uniref:glycosyltransferase family 92 protein n=1 Tax=Oceanibium sediminis TaxID=2026339 RepID=UPI001300A2AA|nr:glycosyltransferase family 92 protein [Oceanibium sediminis]
MAREYPPLIQTSALILPEESPIRRLAPRPRALRHESYGQKFDDRTVIYDLFRSGDPCELIAICPPLFNLLDDLDIRITALPDGSPCPFRVEPRALTERLVIRVPEGCESLRIATRAGTWQVAPAPAIQARFAGARAITTLSRDNDLQWIRDWVTYHVRAQGATAAVIYDNGSRRYTPEALASALEGTGVDVAVVPWPYPYGPNDHRMPATRRVFDSNFCQTSMLDHAWQRLFAQADAVVNADIDELVYTSGPSVFERVTTSETGFLRYTGRWIEPLPIRRGRAPRHRDFWQELRTSVPVHCEPKWAVAPAKLPPNAQWMVHDIAGMIPDADSEDVSFGHFRGINTAVTIDAVGRRMLRRTWAMPFAPTRQVVPLRDAMRAAFAEDAPALCSPPLARQARPELALSREARAIAKAAEHDPDAAPYWIAQAMAAQREFNAPEEMRAHAERAFALAPEDPNAQEVLAASAPADQRIATLERIAALPPPEAPELAADRLMLLAHLATDAAPERAQALASDALALCPDKPGALLVQARLHTAAEDHEAAVRLYGKLLALTLDTVVPLPRQRAYYDSQSRSFRVYFDPCGLHSVPPRLPLRAQANALTALARFEEAVAPAATLAAREPFVFVSQMLHARVLRRAGDGAGARAAALRAAQAARVDLLRGVTTRHFLPRHKRWSAERLLEIGQAQVFARDTAAAEVTMGEIAALGRPGRDALAQLRALLEKHRKAAPRAQRP